MQAKLSPNSPTQPLFSWVLLAAGASTRLGQAKQTLILKQKNLITRQVDLLLQTGLPVAVVQGAVDLASWINPITQSNIHNPNVQLINNPHWQDGMHTSIQQALTVLPKHHLGWVLVDQYAVTTKQCLNFYQHFCNRCQQHKHSVLVSRYHNTLDSWGVPVITSAHLNPTINQAMQAFKQNDKSHTQTNKITGSGLKPWLQANKTHLTWGEWWWPDAQYDIDTKAQWLDVKNQHVKGLINW